MARKCGFINNSEILASLLFLHQSLYSQEILTYFENEIQTAMEDNSTTNNKNDTYASENVYPIDKLQSPIQQAEVKKLLTLT